MGKGEWDHDADPSSCQEQEEAISKYTQQKPQVSKSHDPHTPATPHKLLRVQGDQMSELPGMIRSGDSGMHQTPVT